MTGNLFEDGAPPAGTGQNAWFIAHCDGGSRGNPGPAGYGAVIEDGQGQIVARLSAFLGVQTNNYAEYVGLLAVLKWASENRVRRLRVISDSELMVKQMNGRYRVTSPVLRPLWEEAQRLARKLDGFEITHTLRGGNKEADRLANEAMDRGMGKAGNKGTRDQGNLETRDHGGASGVSSAGGVSEARRASPPNIPQRISTSGSGKPERQVLEGYVKNGVVHLLEGELPEGIFVKVVRES